MRAKRTFPFSVYCKTDLPNYRKKLGCSTAELKTFNKLLIAYVKDMWHYRLFHLADRHTPEMQGLKAEVNTGQPKPETKGNLYSPGILPLYKIMANIIELEFTVATFIFTTAETLNQN